MTDEWLAVDPAYRVRAVGPTVVVEFELIERLVREYDQIAWSGPKPDRSRLQEIHDGTGEDRPIDDGEAHR